MHEFVDPAGARGVHAYRFDVHDVGSWRLDVSDGDVVVTESAAEADLVVGLSEDVLLGIVRGERNPATAFLTGSLRLVGDLTLAPRLQRILPARPGA